MATDTDIIKIRTRKLDPTDFKGARIRVRWNGRTKTVSFPYAANDPHLHAAREATGCDGRILSERGTPRGYVFEIDSRTGF